MFYRHFFASAPEAETTITPAGETTITLPERRAKKMHPSLFGRSHAFALRLVCRRDRRRIFVGAVRASPM
jgi:hypothetical protein